MGVIQLIDLEGWYTEVYESNDGSNQPLAAEAAHPSYSNWKERVI